MKSKDWSLIAVIIFFSAVFSFVITNFSIGSQKTNTLKVENVTPLTDKFPLPNSKYFNPKSINPTQEIKIGDGANANPFNNN